MFNWMFGTSLSVFQYLFMIACVKFLSRGEYLIPFFMILVGGIIIQFIADKKLRKEKQHD